MARALAASGHPAGTTAEATNTVEDRAFTDGRDSLHELQSHDRVGMGTHRSGDRKHARRDGEPAGNHSIPTTHRRSHRAVRTGGLVLRGAQSSVGGCFTVCQPDAAGDDANGRLL
jgi:hypothetical protein